MKKIVHYLVDHIKGTHKGFIVAFLLFLIGSIVLRFYFNIRFLRLVPGNTFISSLLYFGIPFFCVSILHSWFHNDWAHYKKAIFWVGAGVFFGAIFIILYTSLYHDLLVFFPKQTHYLFRKLLFNLQNIIVYATLALGLWLAYGRKHFASYYGLTSRQFDYKPYGWILLLLVPMLVWASFQPDFLKVYPRYRPGEAEMYLGLPNWLTVGVYEIVYALQFFHLELFFRGVVIFVLARSMGNAAVWPMATVYMFFHFTKPMPEAFSSAFGGYILGVVSLYSRNIWGGVMVHVGIAWMMELFAFVQLFILPR